jgi:hypothetical protein
MMRVALMNLGDTPRVFYNKINRAVLVPVGRVVNTDLTAAMVQGLKFPAKPETLLVCEPDTPIPEEMQRVVDLLSIVDFESHETVRQRFHEIAPPNNLTELRPSRMQIRMLLRTMVEDYIIAQMGRETIDRSVPEEPEEEQPPMHPIAQAKQDEIMRSKHFIRERNMEVDNEPPVEQPRSKKRRSRR